MSYSVVAPVFNDLAEASRCVRALAKMGFWAQIEDEYGNEVVPLADLIDPSPPALSDRPHVDPATRWED